MSLFAERQLIEIRIPSGKPGKDGSEALQRYCEHLSDDVLTLVQLPRLDRQQTKSAWFAALDARRRRRCASSRWSASALPAVDRAAPGARRASACRAARPASARWPSLPTASKATCSPRTRRSRSSALLYPAGELSFEQVEAAVLNVARYDVFKLGEAVLAGQVARALRMLDGLRAEGEAAVLVHWTLAEDIRALKRVQDALGDGKPLPLALREARVWGAARSGCSSAPCRCCADAPLAHLVRRGAASATAWSRACKPPRLAGRRLGRPARAGADAAAAAGPRGPGRAPRRAWRCAPDGRRQ